MKNFKRRLSIILSGRKSTLRRMSALRRSELLKRAKSVFDACYTRKELEYLYP